MANTVYGPYTKTSWVDGSTAATQAHMNNLESQAQTALNGFNGDLYSPFVLSGVVWSKDGTNANQLDVTSGRAYATMSDGTLGLIVVASTTFTTSTPSTTYYLFLLNTGAWQWGTTSSGPSNSLAICQATTDASGNILAVTDKRPLNTNMLSGMLGAIKQPIGSGGGTLAWWMQWDATNNRTELFQAGQSNMGLAFVYVDSGGTQRVGFDMDDSGAWALGQGAAGPNRSSPSGFRGDSGGNLTIPGTVTFSGSGVISSQQSGASATGVAFKSWDGSASHTPFSVGGQVSSALTWIDNSGNLVGAKWTGLPTNRGGTATTAEIYTSTSTPVGDGVTTPRTGAVWVKA